MHIELHENNAENSSVAIESFGTQLISPFNLKTIFSNYDFESNRKASHELSISFVHTDNDHVQGICKATFPPSFDSRFDEETDEAIVSSNIGEIVVPLILHTNEACIGINKNISANASHHKVHISWHRKETKERKEIFHAVWFICCKMAVFFFNFVAVIALPFLYVNMYLNLLYIDARTM